MPDALVLGLGGNVGTHDEIVERFVRVRSLVHATRSARLYRSAALGPEQAPFLNTAVLVETDAVPPIFEIELQLGRERRLRWGPRTIDIDVIVWGARELEEPLRIPHPRLAERRFALAPLVDLLGDDFVISGVGRAGDALARVRDQDVELIADDW